MHRGDTLEIPHSGSLDPHSVVSERVQDVAFTLALATASIAFAPLLHGVSPALAIAALTLVACAIVVTVPSYAPAIAIFVLLFQNLFVSILSSVIADPSALEFIKGYNFLNCSVMWLVTSALYVTGRRSHAPQVDRLMIWSAGVFGVVALYFIIGFLQNGLAATIYLRNIVLPLFLFQLSLLTAASFEVRITPTLVAIAVLFLLCGYVELAFRDLWLDITNGYAYWRFDEIKATNSGTWEREMRATGQVLVDLKDRFSFSFLNTPLLEGLGLSNILRVFGPTLSAISYAYGVCFFVLFLFSVQRPLLAIAAIPLAIFCSVKGALIMVLFVCAAWIATRLIGAVATLGVGLVGLVVYAAIGLYVGLQIGDYHVIGFMGGWNGFLQLPFGRGLGAGGNLSENFASIDWSAAQQAGAVDGAVESAVGVLLYQMGIAALVPLAFYFMIAMKTWRLYARSGILTQGFVAFGIFVVLVNGLFQEEALFAPPALGLLTCLAGLVIGNAIRAKQLV
ncbi:MAG: hypothetical protein JWQ17_4230 [Tardiphaga sp.]|nr:hypothetical protein [Tardiphaga sp.]